MDNVVALCEVRVGDAFVTNQLPLERAIPSRIVATEVGEKGVKFLRVHPYHNGESFFLSFEQLNTSHWIKLEVPDDLKVVDEAA